MPRQGGREQSLPVVGRSNRAGERRHEALAGRPDAPNVSVNMCSSPLCQFMPRDSVLCYLKIQFAMKGNLKHEENEI